MSNHEQVWSEKSDKELIQAWEKLLDFSEESRNAIVAELQRRGLTNPSKDKSCHEEAVNIRESLECRYTDAYRVVDAIIGIGSLVKVVGGLLGLALAAYGLFGFSNSGNSALLFIIPGVVIGFLFWVVGVVASAVGQLLSSSVDTAVNTSPLISNIDKAYIMGLE